MIGSFIGWQPIVVVFFIAPFLGLVVGVVQWLARGNNVLPYGPYLSLAAIVTLLTWGNIWAVVQGHFQVLGLIPVPIAIALVLPIVLWCCIRSTRNGYHTRPETKMD